VRCSQISRTPPAGGNFNFRLRYDTLGNFRLRNRSKLFFLDCTSVDLIYHLIRGSSFASDRRGTRTNSNNSFSRGLSRNEINNQPLQAITEDLFSQLISAKRSGESEVSSPSHVTLRYAIIAPLTLRPMVFSDNAVYNLPNSCVPVCRTVTSSS
jgi:hypothetical protein